MNLRASTLAQRLNPIQKSDKQKLGKRVIIKERKSRFPTTGSSCGNYFETLLYYGPLVVIASCLDSCSYIQLLHVCRPMRKLTDRSKYVHLKQNDALDRIELYRRIFDCGQNVFLTGCGGTGKTHFLNRLYEIATKRLRIPTIMTATTGTACLNLINGRTIHSFSGLGKGTIPIEVLSEDLKDERKCRFYQQWKQFHLLIMDEASMLGKRLIEKVDLVARTIRQSDKPFGGMQVVFSGDFLQLAPVADTYAFKSAVWTQLSFFNWELKFPYRHDQDLPYFRTLQRIRVGKLSADDIDMLEHKRDLTRSICLDDLRIKPTHIFCYHKDVAKLNREEFEKLTTPIEIDHNAEDLVMERRTVHLPGHPPVVTFEPSNRITVQEANQLLKNRAEHTCPFNIKFRDGAQYILTFNFNVKRGKVNGSRMAYRTGGFLEFRDGSIDRIERYLQVIHFPVPSHPNLFLRRKQFAARLGYACTIHSSQGMSLDCACIDLEKTFASAMAYVALSRVRSSDGLYLKAFKKTSVKTNKEAKAFHETIKN